jgi:hypothetical protein
MSVNEHSDDQIIGGCISVDFFPIFCFLSLSKEESLRRGQTPLQMMTPIPVVISIPTEVMAHIVGVDQEDEEIWEAI